MHNKIVFLVQTVPEGRVFGLDLQTLISIGIQLLNAIILAIALSYILYKPVKKFMQKRTDKIQNKIDEADAAMAKANELIAQYKEKLKRADKESDEILEAARLKALDESKIILEEARREAYEIKKRSMDSVLEDKERLKEETRLHIIELSSLIAQKYITQNINDETQDKLLEKAIAQLEDTKWQN